MFIASLSCHTVEETLISLALLGKFIFSYRTRFKDTSRKGWNWSQERYIVFHELSKEFEKEIFL